MNGILFTWYSEKSSLLDFEEGLRLAIESDANSLLILACDGNDFTSQQITPLITQCPLTLFGGIYPKLVYKKQLMDFGCIIIGFRQEVEVSLITQVSTFKSDDQIEEAIEKIEFNQKKTPETNNFLMFYDALINNLEPFIDCLSGYVEQDTEIIGGGAGSLQFMKKPCVFSNQGLLDDVIQLVSFKSKLTIGATHGWEILKGPFLVSEAEDQTVISLNYTPAFNIYKEAIQSVSDYTFNDDNFFDIAKHFPLGVEDVNDEMIVRDPILTYDGYLQCVGNVPVNSMVYLLKGNIGSLIESAKKAAILATQKVEGGEFSATIVFDCISRVLYMEDDFNKELNLIAEQCTVQTLFGALCLGEITKNQSGAIKLLNKSTVIGSW